MTDVAREDFETVRAGLHDRHYSALDLEALARIEQRLREIEDNAPPTPKEWHAVNGRAERAEARVRELEEALREIGGLGVPGFANAVEIVRDALKRGRPTP